MTHGRVLLGSQEISGREWGGKEIVELKARGADSGAALATVANSRRFDGARLVYC
jgi:trehalose-6-phosphatase